jgi:hypothetical protein
MFILNFLKPKQRVNLLTTIISVITIIYIIEFYLLLKQRFISQYNQNNTLEKIYKNETGQIYDKRNRLDIYNLEKKLNSNLQVTVEPFLFLNDEINLFPLSGISNSLTLYCNENGYFSYFNSDRYGFQNPNEVWNNKEIDYVLVGDSFTLGACVNPPNDISGNLRRLLKKDIINLGYGGNGPLIAYSTLREYLPHINSKNILYLFWEENELDDLQPELKNHFLFKYYNQENYTQNLYFRQEEINKLNLSKINDSIYSYYDLKKLEFRTHILQTLKLYKLRIYIKSTLHKKEKVTPSQIPEFKQLLIKFKKLAENKNSNFYFVYLPTYNRYDNNFKNSIYKETIDLLNELNIEIIDIKNLFDNHPDPKSLFPFRMHAHYNVQGYKFVSEGIFNALINKNKELSIK